MFFVWDGIALHPVGTIAQGSTCQKDILDRGRAVFASPREGRRKVEARWFGSIAHSRGPQLVVLCIGCGVVMVLPLYVIVLSVLISLSGSLSNSGFSQPVLKVPWGLFLIQGLASIGVITASIVVLIAIYLFYLNLGRWFSKRNAHNS